MSDAPALPVVSTPATLRPTVARVTCWTADAERLEAFYTELFGFSRVARAILGDDANGAAIVRSWGLAPGTRMQTLLLRAPRGGTELGITAVVEGAIPDAPDRAATPRGGDTYLVLYVPDLDAVIARCEARNVAFVRPPKRLLGPDGCSFYELAITDPDGRVLLVVEDVAPLAS